MQLIWVFATVLVVLFLGVALIVASTRYGWPVPRAIGWVLVGGIGMMALSFGAMQSPLWALGSFVGPVVALVVGLVLIISPTRRQNRKTRTIAIVLIVTGLLAILLCIAWLMALVEAL